MSRFTHTLSALFIGSVYTGSHVADSVVFVVFFHVCVGVGVL